MKHLANLTIAGIMLLALLCCQRGGPLGPIKTNEPDVPKPNIANDTLTRHFGVDFGRTEYFISHKLMNVGYFPVASTDYYSYYTHGTFYFDGFIYNSVIIYRDKGTFTGICYILHPHVHKVYSEGVFESIHDKYAPDEPIDSFLNYREFKHAYDNDVEIYVKLESNTVDFEIKNTKLYKSGKEIY